MIKHLKWDSNFFNKKVGELQVNYDKTHYKIQEYYDIIYALQKVEADVVIENFHVSYREEKLLFQKKISFNTITEENVFSIKKTNFDVNTLYNLAFVSGQYSRFKQDEKFKDDIFSTLYIAWVDNSINFKIADEVLIYKEFDIIKGFVTLKLLGDRAKIGLIAVDNENQGLGIGKKLIWAAENYCCRHNCFHLQIPTQSINVKACKFYENLGYSITDKIIIKHFWKNDSV